MSTSLATQLRQLAVPSTNIYKDDKKRCSLLFDPKEAASIRGDIVFEIGLEGLQQLVAKDETFLEFLDNLFHPSSKDFDRNIHSKEENKKIDKIIKRFFVVIGPYILTNAAHKALEWLYFRYHINEFNKTDLITTVIPYYTTNIFVRVVQTCSFNQTSDPYYFLSAIKKSGTQLDRLSLFRQVHSNGKIIKCLTKFLTQLLKTHSDQTLTVHFNFYCTILCGAIEVSKDIKDPFITEILPLLLEGLSSEIPDFASATFVITARLLSKCTLSRKLLDVILEKVFDLKCKSVAMEAALLVTLVYQLQPQYTVLSEGALSNLLQSSSLLDNLGVLHSTGSCVYPCLKVIIEEFLKRGISENEPAFRLILCHIVNKIEFDSSFITYFIGLLLDKTNKKAINNVDIKYWLQDIINMLQSKYSDKFTDSMAKVFKDENADHRHQIVNKLRLNKRKSKHSINWTRIDFIQPKFEEKLLSILKGLVKLVGKSVVPIPKIEDIKALKTSLNNAFEKLKSFGEYEESRSLIEPMMDVDSSDVNKIIEGVLNVCSAGVLSETSLQGLLYAVEKTLPTSQCFQLQSVTAGINLLAILSNESSDIRNTTIEVMSQLLKNQETETNCSWFLTKLLTYKEEILADSEQVALATLKLMNFPKGKRFLSDITSIMCLKDTPLHVTYGALQLTVHINDFQFLEQLNQHFLELFKNRSEFSNLESKILCKLVESIQQPIISQVTLTAHTWRFIVFALNKMVIIDTSQEEAVTLPTIVLGQLSKDLYHFLPEDLLAEFLGLICDLSAISEDPQFSALASKIFKHIDLDVNLVAKILKGMSEIQSDRPITPRKRPQGPTLDVVDTLAWKKGVCLLEFIQSKKKIRNSQILLPILFDILKKCLDFEEQAMVEYPKQLTLSLLLLICGKLENETVSEKNFNIELVIQCIRASQNPQTHYHAMLVLAHAAKVVPNEVLHHVMAVFTFVGSTLVRHDDTYSFEIISKILDTIIPILVSQQRTTTIEDVLRVFVDALMDVPEHRRVSLYTQLLNHVDAKQNLYLFLLFVLETEVLHPIREKKKAEKETPSQRIQISLQLSGEFSVETMLHTCSCLLKYINDLPDEKEEDMPQTHSLNLKSYTAKQFRHLKYLIITFVSSLLSSKSLIVKLSAKENLHIEGLYKEIIISVLSYIQRTQKVCDSGVNSPQAVYWKTILYHSYDLLDNVNDLLSSRMFLLVIKGLLVHSMLMVKKRALEVLNTKLQSGFSHHKSEDDQELFVLVKPILMIIEPAGLQSTLPSDQETLIQTALLSMKLIVKTLGPNDPERFIQVLDFISNILHSGKVQGNVQASVILCLAELCSVLRGHALPSLTSFMSAFLAVLKKQKSQDTCSMLLLSIVTAVNKLLESFATLLSPYLPKIICECSILISKWSSSSEDPKCQPLITRLNGIKKKLASVIPVRVLVPIIDQCYDILLAKQYHNAIVALISILEEQLSGLSSSDVSLNMSEFTNFFLKSLEFRSKDNASTEIANLVEGQLVKTLTAFTLKLSESTFRPFYLKLFDWAIRSGDSHERLITFYHLSEHIGQALKGLFVLFAGNILSNASEIMRDVGSQEKTDTEKSILLLEYVLKTLKAIFTYDSKKLINRERFELLMQPLVDLLEKDIDGIETLIKRNVELITPTIVQFAVAVADDGLWKEMNYQILLKMRNSKPEMRLVSLHCLAEIVAKLREDFMPLLPETIPFLAELLEDEDERVEKACQKAVREMEKVLGEPLQKYF
ncbi:HEAT repeat-containing protein 1 [Euwallacea fornicatus]|uniref:HEAT repeat-containing protein 1 n=1 Tax=Euwallacea fornicatus TaxID=995702 RepID=UPI00338FCA6D